MKTVLSLFSGCGGMDLGFVGSFVANRKSFPSDSPYIERSVSEDWVLLKKTVFQTVFANDILPDARVAWLDYMRRFGVDESIFHSESIVDIVKKHREGAGILPENVDVVLGGFPCQDFSVAGKRRGFNSHKDHNGKFRTLDEPMEETRGCLYLWMKEVIELTKPKIFIAENVKGLVNLGDVKQKIQSDFASANGNGYIVLPPKVLHAGDYGVPESRERVFFIGVRKNALLPEALCELQKETVSPLYDPYPKPTHCCTFADKCLCPKVTTSDVLKDLAEPDVSDDPSQQYYSRAKFMPNGSQGQTEIKIHDIAPTIRSEHHGNIEFRRLSKDHGGTHCEELAKGCKERRLTPRECALIQTFPPDYAFVLPNGGKKRFKLSPSGAYKIIGNAVPPVLAYNLAMRIQSVWKLYFGDND